MELPVVGGKVPVVVTLEAGSYWWCTCGKSKNQPWCDGSHEGSNFSPKEVVLTEAKRVAMCTCKRTKNSPFCDGSHKGL